MSHFVRIKTTITDRTLLKLSMERTLKWPVLENDVIRDYYSNTIEAQLVARNPSGRYDVGFSRKPGKLIFEMLADFHGLPYREEELLDKITQNYSFAMLEKYAMAGRYDMTKAVYDEAGGIRTRLTIC